MSGTGAPDVCKMTNMPFPLRVIKPKRNGDTIQEINTFDGDGMCMGFHDCLHVIGINLYQLF